MDMSTVSSAASRLGTELCSNVRLDESCEHLPFLGSEMKMVREMDGKYR